MNELTKEQQSAMRPWVITAFVAMIVRLLAVVLFCVYLVHAGTPNFKLVALWLAAMMFIPHFFVIICSRHITRIKGIDQHEGLFILTIISFLALAALSYFTW